MAKNSLEMYRLPLGLSQTTPVELPHSDVVFHVMLPSQLNEDFSAKLMARMSSSISFDEEGNVERSSVDPGEFMNARRDLFFEGGIVSADGLPDNMTVDAFFDEFALARRVLWERVQIITMEADQQVESAMEKFVPSLGGSGSGEGKKNDTTI